MNNSYSNLCIFNFGKHSYVVMKNADKVMYFESVDGKYVMPITNFNLYDNQGKSLTVVNQHFFMNQLVSRLNVAFKKGYFSNVEDVTKYLNDLKGNCENNVDLKKLFKGSLMSEINESNFEHNKKEILKFLDKYRFDTFVNYNNVAIFSGSLDKSSSNQSGVVPAVGVPVQPVTEVPIQNFDFSSNAFSDVENVDQRSTVESAEPVNVEQPIVEEQQSIVENVEVPVEQPIEPVVEQPVNVQEPIVENVEVPVEQPNLEQQSVVEQPIEQTFEQVNVEQPIVEEQRSIVENVEVPVEQPIEPVVEQPIVEEQPVVQNVEGQSEVNSSIVNNTANDDIFNFNTVANESSNFVDSNDYFSSLGSVSQEKVLQGPVVAGVSSDDYFSQFTDSPSQPAVSFEQPAVNNVVENNQVNEVNEVMSNQQNNSNVSYLDEVQNRLVSNNFGQSSFNDSLNQVGAQQSVVQPVQSVVSNEVSESINTDESELENLYSTEVEQANESFGFSNSNSTIGDAVIDNSKKSELEEISSDPLEVPETPEPKKKGKLGIIIFMIFLVLALAALSFYLYKYVF